MNFSLILLKEVSSETFSLNSVRNCKEIANFALFIFCLILLLETML